MTRMQFYPPKMKSGAPQMPRGWDWWIWGWKLCFSDMPSPWTLRGVYWAPLTNLCKRVSIQHPFGRAGMYVYAYIYIYTRAPIQTVTPNRNSHNLFQPSWKSSHCAPCSGLPAGRLLRRRRFLQQLLLHPSSCFVGVLRLRICDFIDQLIYQIITYCWDKLIYSNWYKFVQ